MPAVLCPLVPRRMLLLMARKRLLCRLGWHKWRTEVNDSGERYETCRLCGTFHDGPGPTANLGAG